MILKPFVCGKTKIFFPSICSDSPYFTGTVDTTIRQGTDFDLRDGVNAYDGDGMTIPFTVTPSEVEVCQLGVQSFVYEAEGAKDTRYITVVAVDNPTITGLTPLTVKVGEEFDPLIGVTARDGNGKTIPSSDIDVEDGDTPTPPTPPTPTQRYTVTLHAGTGGTVSGGGTFDSGTQITVTASANSGYSFSSWRKGSASGTSVSSSSSYTFTVTENVDLYAVFTEDAPTPTKHTVSVYAGTGGTVSGGGEYNEGDTATVTAGLYQYYTFNNWRKGSESGEIVSTSSTYSFTVTEDVSLYATFTYHAPTTYCNINLSVETDGDASDTSGGTVSGGGQVREGTSVTVTATPAQYYHFAHWRENGAIVSSDNPYTFTANSSRSLVARFLQDTSYSESIGITHNAGESMSSYTISGPVNSGVNITVHYTYQYDTGDGSASASFTQGSSGSKTDSHTGITISYAGGKTIKVSGGDTGSITLTSVRVML